MFQFTWTDGTIHHRMPSLSMLQVHIHADAHTHTDNTQIDPDTPHWFPKPSSPTPPDGEPCGNAPCAEVSGWEMGMSQFSEVEWPLPFDLPWCTVVFFGGVQDVKTGLLTIVLPNINLEWAVLNLHTNAEWFETPWLHFTSWMGMSSDMEHTSCLLPNDSSFRFRAPDVGRITIPGLA